jgi:hypothetical protein
MNSDGPEDTDTLLALLCSLLPENIALSQQNLLEVLLQTEGDVEMAAGIISKQRTNRKRKRNTSLDSWLTRPGSAAQPERPGVSSLPSCSAGPSHDQLASDSSPQKKPKSEGSATSTTTQRNQPSFSKPLKPLKNLLEVLRPQASATAKCPTGTSPPIDTQQPFAGDTAYSMHASPWCTSTRACMSSFLYHAPRGARLAEEQVVAVRQTGGKPASIFSVHPTPRQGR